MRDEQIHQALLAWAAWLTVGDGSGYPTTSPLHRSWSPPSPGVTPTLKAGKASAQIMRTHRAVAGLNDRLRATVTMVYCYPSLGTVEHARRLCVAERTVQERIVAAHAQLRWLMPTFSNMRQSGYIRAS